MLGSLYQSYRSACLLTGEYIRSTTDFYGSLEKIGFTNLANAIVLSAVKDYRDALKRLKKKPNNKLAADERDDIERFFRSGYFTILTEIDPEYLIDRLNKEV